MPRAAGKEVAVFVGFVATPVDAAYLVEAAIAQKLPCMIAQQGRVGEQDLTQSGTVVIFGPQIERWKDHRKWTPRRAQNKGFDFYRETTTVKEEAMTEIDIETENANEQRLKPYVGPYGAKKEQIKRNGLIKKTISFIIDGEQWGVAAYYTMAAIAAGNLRRPRSANMALPLPRSEFWHQEGANKKRSGARRIVMTDDDNDGLPADWETWSRAPEVLPPPAPAALAISAIRAVPAALAAPAAAHHQPLYVSALLPQPALAAGPASPPAVQPPVAAPFAAGPAVAPVAPFEPLRLDWSAIIARAFSAPELAAASFPLWAAAPVAMPAPAPAPLAWDNVPNAAVFAPGPAVAAFSSAPAPAPFGYENFVPAAAAATALVAVQVPAADLVDDDTVILLRAFEGKLFSSWAAAPGPTAPANDAVIAELGQPQAPAALATSMAALAGSSPSRLDSGYVSFDVSCSSSVRPGSSGSLATALVPSAPAPAPVAGGEAESGAQGSGLAAAPESAHPAPDGFPPFDFNEWILP